MLVQMCTRAGFVLNEPGKLQAQVQPHSGCARPASLLLLGKVKSAWSLPGLSQPGVCCEDLPESCQNDIPWCD